MHLLISSFDANIPPFSVNILIAACILAGFWLAGTLIARVLRRLAAASDDDRRQIFNLLASVSKTALLACGIVAALGKLQVKVSALVAGLGLTGFALGFAFRDALSNLLAGMLILFYQPFKRDDRILVAGFEGTVRKIDMRYTTIEVHDGRALIPNSTLLNTPVHVIEE